MDDDSRYRFKDVKLIGKSVHGLDVVLQWEEINQMERFSDVTGHQISCDALSDMQEIMILSLERKLRYQKK